MKKLLYIALENINDSKNGVSKKIYMQCKAFSKKYQVTFIGYGENEESILQSNNMMFKSFTNKYNFIPSRFIYLLKLDKYLKYNSFDICYIRYPYIDILLLKVLGTLKDTNTKIFMEIASYPIIYPEVSIKNLFKYPLYIFDRLGLKKIHKYVYKIVSIGSPISRLFGVDVINISNGSDIELVQAHTKPFDKSKIRILCLASMYFYQGFDRLLNGLSNYYHESQEIEILIEFVGDGPELVKYKNLAMKLNLDKYVNFHGELNSDEIDNLSNKIDLGCSILALHRSNLNYASPLKSKEYLARGIPFIYSYNEINFPEDFPFALKIEPSEKPVDFEQVLIFFKSLNTYENNVYKEMRDFTNKHFNWSEILDFI